MEKAIAVVGHSNWGKSYTLKSFIGSPHKHWIKIGETWYYVKHMSNDDISGRLLAWIEEFIIKYSNQDYGLIFALCPDFENLEKKTEQILKLFQDKDIKLGFFVLKQNFRNTLYISNDEIEKLKHFGKLNLFDGREEANIKAKALLTYVKSF
jgi:hypothetical protein